MRAASLCLLFAGLAQAIDVYLYPSSGRYPGSELASGPASAALATHLGLERFETLDESQAYDGVFDEQLFVGQGGKSGLLLSLSDDDVNEVLPRSMGLSFSISDAPTTDSLSSLISTYLHRASRSSLYKAIFSTASLPPTAQNPPRLLDLFSVSSPSTDKFISEATTVSTFLDAGSADGTRFAAVELNGLAEIASTYGRSSEQYALAASTTRAILSSAASQPNLHIALLTFASLETVQARQQAASPKQSPLPPSSSSLLQPPLGSSSCFSSADTCDDATGGCSGRGHCVQTSKAGKTCFVCACTPVITEEGKKETWVGDACQRKDVSGPFVLLAGTAIGLVILIASSVSLLYTIGNHELPSVLLGAVAGSHSKRD